MKSRAIWLEAGDENTKFFHQFANMHCISNAIWECSNDDGTIVNDMPSIKDGFVYFFSKLYMHPPSNNIRSS